MLLPDSIIYLVFDLHYQDSFRQLLKTPRVGASSSLGAASRSRGFVAPPPKLWVHCQLSRTLAEKLAKEGGGCESACF
jgi:hypothetical protein